MNEKDRSKAVHPSYGLMSRYIDLEFRDVDDVLDGDDPIFGEWFEMWDQIFAITGVIDG